MTEESDRPEGETDDRRSPSSTTPFWQRITPLATWALLFVGLALTLTIGAAKALDIASSGVFTGLLLASAVVTMVVGALKAFEGRRPPHVAAAIAGVLVVAVALVGVLAVIAPAPPGPERMTGEFNVAVTEFDSPGGDGDAQAAAAGLSTMLADYLALEVEALNDERIVIEVRGPDEIGVLEGSTMDDRAVSARELAAEIDADLVIYGQLEEENTRSRFQPEFVFTARRVGTADELLGHHELGNPIYAAGNAIDAQADLRDSLSDRTVAFGQFILGLTEYRRDENEAAIEHFQAAIDATNEDGDLAWPEEDGKEILHLFLGNAALRNDQYDLAAEQYGRAIELSDGQYARAYIGVGEIEPLRAGCGVSGTGDPDRLAAALESYDRALELPDQPAASNIRARAALGAANAEICLGDLAAAETSFLRAVEEIGEIEVDADGVPVTPNPLAAEAHMGVGLAVATGTDPDNDDPGVVEAAYRRALGHYQQALPLHVSPVREALTHAWLGLLHGRLGETKSADASCAEARSFGYGDRSLASEEDEEASDADADPSTIAQTAAAIEAFCPS